MGRGGGNAPNIVEAYPELQEKIQDILKNLEIANTLEILKLEKQKIFEFKLKTDITEDAVNIVDVGCGTSQILPLLVQGLFQSLYSQDGSVVIIEQPEVHLHPKMQADFASFLVDNIKPKTKFLIETHSDYFIERIRYCIMNELIPADNVAVYYIRQDKAKKSSTVTRIRINPKGQYLTSNLPDGNLPENYLTEFRSIETDKITKKLLETL